MAEHYNYLLDNIEPEDVSGFLSDISVDEPVALDDFNPFDMRKVA